MKLQVFLDLFSCIHASIKWHKHVQNADIRAELWLPWTSDLCPCTAADNHRMSSNVDFLSGLKRTNQHFGKFSYTICYFISILIFFYWLWGEKYELLEHICKKNQLLK